jgi:ZIP family zinc transporter
MALAATLGTWGVTALGAATVVFFKSPDRRVMNMMLGFAAGVMIAASFWSLLSPAVERAEMSATIPAFAVVTLGFLAGALFLWGSDKVVTHAQGAGASPHRTLMLILSITLHNIPEGLAVGFAFGAAYATGLPASYAMALGLAVGIGVQNLPEGAAVSLPLKMTFHSPHKAFLYGVFSALAEPIFAVIGFYFSAGLQVLQPWLLAFAAGAMIFVVAEELLPASKAEGHSWGAWGVMIGFTIMMILDVALGA